MSPKFFLLSPIEPANGAYIFVSPTLSEEIIENNKKKLLKENKDSWNLLSSNPSFSAIKLLEKYPEKINWNELSSNPSAIHILEKNLDKINWMVLSKNPNAIYLLEKNKKK